MLPEDFHKVAKAICDYYKLPRGLISFKLESSIPGHWTTLTLIWKYRPQRLISLDPSELDALNNAILKVD